MITVLIIGTSASLFICWLRCTVLLILRSMPARSCAHEAAEANGMNFLDLRRRLYSLVSEESLPMLCEMLKKDLKLTKILLQQMGPETGGRISSDFLLTLNFRLLGLRFAVLRRFRPGSARSALAEMSATLEYFSNCLSRRLALASQPARF
ncbi:MAG TPA: hypothetical protein VFA54_08720 [Bryobacterales bacterium]|nr:hypothetical protein [Bryobacterales bacterium]